MPIHELIARGGAFAVFVFSALYVLQNELRHQARRHARPAPVTTVAPVVTDAYAKSDATDAERAAVEQVARVNALYRF